MQQVKMSNGIKRLHDYLTEKNLPSPEWLEDVFQWVKLPRFAEEPFTNFQHLIESKNSITGFYRLDLPVSNDDLAEAIFWLVESLSDEWMCFRQDCWYFRSSKDMAMFKLRWQ